MLKSLIFVRFPSPSVERDGADFRIRLLLSPPTPTDPYRSNMSSYTHSNIDILRGARFHIDKSTRFSGLPKADSNSTLKPNPTNSLIINDGNSPCLHLSSEQTLHFGPEPRVQVRQTTMETFPRISRLSLLEQTLKSLGRSEMPPPQTRAHFPSNNNAHNLQSSARVTCACLVGLNLRTHTRLDGTTDDGTPRVGYSSRHSENPGVIRLTWLAMSNFLHRQAFSEH